MTDNLGNNDGNKKLPTKEPPHLQQNVVSLQIFPTTLFLINSAVRGWGKIQAEKFGVLPQLWLFRWGRTAWESVKFEVALRCAIIKVIICSVIGATEAD